MHRFSESTDFSPLLGSDVIQVCLGQNEVILNLYPTSFIRLEGAWLLKDERGRAIDGFLEHADRDVWRIHVVLGRKISKCVVLNERRLDISFEGFTLEITDDSDFYETFAIEHPALKLYV